jgi:hypothetical protein
MRYKKEVVAIAKNESAYLALWCAHYTYLGFDKITIYLNGIDDHSHLIIRKIREFYPHVEIRNSDRYGTLKMFKYDFLIDKDFLTRNPMQSRAYAEAYDIAGKNGFDYVLFVDIDEYLTHRKKGVTIDGILNKYDSPEFLKFRWFNIATNTKEFDFPLATEVKGVFSDVPKFILKTNLEGVTFRSTHQVSTKNVDKRYLSGLGRIKDYDKQQIKDSIDSDLVLLHNLYRSEVEYLATLLRGDFIFKSSQGIKLNRKGLLREDQDVLDIDQEVVEAFHEHYNQLIRKADLNLLVEAAQELLRVKAYRLETICRDIDAEYKKIKKVLKGTSIEF